MNISNNLASIQAHQSMMNTSANNVANINTDGFIPSGTNITNSQSTPQAKTFRADDNGSLQSQTNLTKEIVDQVVAQDATEANVKAIRSQDEILGSLLDIKA